MDPAKRRLPAIVSALRHRNFQLFFGGQLISLCGTWMQAIAQSWLVYRLTGSAPLLGLVGFASQFPVLPLGPVGGAAADRFSRRSILICTQASAMLLAFALAALTLSGVVTVAAVFVLSALLGVVNAFDMPARQAFVVEMVARDDLGNAIALNSSMVNGARVVGPAIAGLLVGAVGEGYCFLANGLSYLAVIGGLVLMRVPRAAGSPHPGAAGRGMAAGFRFALGARPVRDLLLLIGVVSLAGMPYSVLMPIFADEILHAGPSGLGVLMGVTGVGALIGALTLAARRGIGGLGRWVAAATAGFGVSLALFAFSRAFWLSVLMLVPAGFGMMVALAGSNTLIQSMVPDQLRGRVMAVYSMMFFGMGPFGALLAGTFAGRLGAPATVAAGGVLSAAAALLFAARVPKLRLEARALVGGSLPEGRR